MSLPLLIVLSVSSRDSPNTLKSRLFVLYVSSTVDRSVCLKRLSEYSKYEIIYSPHLFHQWIILSVSPSSRDYLNSMIWPKTTVILSHKNNSRCLFKRQQEHDKIRNCHHKSASKVEPLKISSKFCYIVSLIDYQASVWLSVCVSVSPFVSLSFSFSVSLLLLVSLSQSVSLNLSVS